jgi:hypothetical protein
VLAGKQDAKFPAIKAKGSIKMMTMDVLRLPNNLSEIIFQITYPSQSKDQLNSKTGKVNHAQFVCEVHIRKAGTTLFSAYLSGIMAANPSCHFMVDHLIKDDKLTVIWVDSLGKQEKLDYIVLV